MHASLHETGEGLGDVGSSGVKKGVEDGGGVAGGMRALEKSTHRRRRLLSGRISTPH